MGRRWTSEQTFLKEIARHCKPRELVIARALSMFLIQHAALALAGRAGEVTIDLNA